jgi:hypothetical protein
MADEATMTKALSERKATSSMKSLVQTTVLLNRLGFLYSLNDYLTNRGDKALNLSNNLI